MRFLRICSEGVTIQDCSDSHVYLLDHSSEVEVFGCVNCTIFIGPVDGPAIFEDCSNCQVAAASQQFQAKGCHDCSFGLYSATGPTLSQCTGIRISPWCGSYSQLDNHFISANLDPQKNQFSHVYDASQNDECLPNFSLFVEPGEPWIVDEESSYTSKDTSCPHIAPKMEGREENGEFDDGNDVCTSEGWIKAVKTNVSTEAKSDAMSNFGKEEWQKTLELIDLDKNSNLSRFKSVLLSICNDGD